MYSHCILFIYSDIPFTTIYKKPSTTTSLLQYPFPFSPLSPSIPLSPLSLPPSLSLSLPPSLSPPSLPSLPLSLPLSLPPSLSGLAGENNLDNCELAGIVDAIADAWSEVFLAYFKQKSEQLKVCEINDKGWREGGTDKGESYTHEHTPSTCTHLHSHTHTRTLTHSHSPLHAPAHHSLTHSHSHTHTFTLSLTLTHTLARTHKHTQEEKEKELHETILPPLLQQLNHMVESNNFAKGWIWGDKVYTYAEREEGGVCG